MRLLLATGHPHLPQFSGGSQSSTHELAIELKRRGQCVAVLAALSRRGYLGLAGRLRIKLGDADFALDDGLGYRVYRKWRPWEGLRGVVSSWRPDVAIIQAIKPVMIAEELTRQGTPTIIYFRDAEIDSLGGDPRQLRSTTFVANSQFTAAFYLQKFGIRSEVIRPLFDASRYEVERAPANVTFINPVAVKGVDLALAIAKRCPQIPFQFVESWPLARAGRMDLEGRLQGLDNVRFRRRTGDMRTIYRSARIVLIPSQWAEAWGRVASEAHFSGIPVLASDIGGLPEAVGPGGVVLDPSASADEWADVLSKIWSDKQQYARLSAAALAYSKRDALDPARQIAALLDIAKQSISRYAKATQSG